MSKKKKNEFDHLSSGMGTGFGRIEKIKIQEDNTVVGKKYKEPEHITGPCSYEQMLRDAENFEGFLNIVKWYAIYKNIPPKKYKKAVKRIEKMISLLREGRGDEVYDKERYEAYMERMERSY